MSRLSLRYTVALSVYTIKYLGILRLVCALHHRHSSLRRSGQFYRRSGGWRPRPPGRVCVRTPHTPTYTGITYTHDRRALIRAPRHAARRAPAGSTRHRAAAHATVPLGVHLLCVRAELVRDYILYRDVTESDTL